MNLVIQFQLEHISQRINLKLYIKMVHAYKILPRMYTDRYVANEK